MIKTNGDGTVTISIEDILRDKKFQGRRRLDKSTLVKYSEIYKRGGTLPPITLAKVKKTYVLVDGWHRVKALEHIERGTVEAVVLDVSAKEAYKLAIQANLNHGLPLKSSDIRLLFKMFMGSSQHRDKDRFKSSREIAEELGNRCHFNTILTWMKKDFPFIYNSRYTGEKRGMKKSKLHEAGAVSEEDNTFLGITHDALRRALLTFHSIDDEAEKGIVIQQVEAMLNEMRTAGSYQKYEPDF